MDYKIDYGSVALKPNASRPADVPLYATIDGRVASLANDEVLFYDPLADRNHVMTTQVLKAMDLCRGFQPMEQHIRTVAATLPGLQGQESAVRRVLEGLAARGLLVTDDAFLLRFSRAPVHELPAPTAIFIRACDRPAQLQRLLTSLAAHVDRHGTQYRIVVVDDSSNSDAVAEHARLLQHYCDSGAGVTVHIERSRWQAIVDALGRALPEHAGALSTLLQRDPRYRGRRGGGIGKNLITLLAAGERYLLLDDDFELPLRRHPDYRPGLAFDARAWAVRTFEAQELALAAGDETDGDPLALTLALCGQTLGGALGRVDGFALSRASLQGLMPSRMPTLRPEARIAATINGHRGAAGAGGLTWLYLLDGAGRAGLTASETGYQALRGDPPTWWGTRRFLLGGGSHFTPFAIDNRQLLPATSPFGRGEDGLFNALLGLVDGNAQLLDVPYAIGHVQEAGRDRSTTLASADTPDINTCLAELARHVAGDLYAEQPAPRLGLFAARLDDLAGGSDATVISYLREYLSYRRSTAIEQLQRVAAADPEAPAYWSADQRALIELNGRAVADRGPPRFAGWPDDATAGDCAAAFRRETQALAAGLRAWPAAWEVALRERETWLSP